MSQLSPKALLVALVLMVLIVVMLFLSLLAVRIALYVPQTVSIDRIDVLCSKRPPRRQIPWVTPPRRWSSDCAGLRRQFGRSDVSEDTFISFAYASPADRRNYRGVLQRSLNDLSQPARTGDRIEIEASRLMPETFTDWSSPSIDPENVIRPTPNGY
ncbi:hypothetical protein [Neorhizobium sp. LjRoot104]|uniref:hypothetical protein n=1 Tax=Neorhizobium sp. LjRoot104 TaxID=3342254 RepID=UPI003ECC322F